MENPNIAATNKRRSTLILLNVCVGHFIVGLDQRALLVGPSPSPAWAGASAGMGSSRSAAADVMSPENKPNTKRRSRLILLSVCIGQIIVGLDLRAITVALPTLATTFHTPFTTIQWTILVYDLVLIGLIITMGRLGDLFGRRRFYSLGFLIFVIASALCGLAQTTGQLIFFRAAQAIGGSMIAANGRAIVSVNLPLEERGRALGLTSTAFHIGFLTGPALGGFLIDTIGWRWIFYINMPFSLWGAYLAWKVVPETRTKETFAVDILGALLLLLTNGLFIYAIDQLPRVGWRHPAFLLTLALSSLALCFLLRTEARAKTPILTLSMFRARLFSAGILSLFLIAGTLSAINFLLPFYLQYLLGYSPSQVGWIIVVDSVIIMVMAPIAGALSDRLGSRLLCTIGCAIVALAQFFLATLDIQASLLRIMFPLMIWGVGWALFNAPNQSSILGAVSPDRIGAAAGMIATTARAGGAMGVALSATLFGHLVAAAGLSSSQVSSPESWRPRRKFLWTRSTRRSTCLLFSRCWRFSPPPFAARDRGIERNAFSLTPNQVLT